MKAQLTPPPQKRSNKLHSALANSSIKTHINKTLANQPAAGALGTEPYTPAPETDLAERDLTRPNGQEICQTLTHKRDLTRHSVQEIRQMLKHIRARIDHLQAQHFPLRGNSPNLDTLHDLYIMGLKSFAQEAEAKLHDAVVEETDYVSGPVDIPVPSNTPLAPANNSSNHPSSTPLAQGSSQCQVAAKNSSNQPPIDVDLASRSLTACRDTFQTPPPKWIPELTPQMLNILAGREDRLTTQKFGLAVLVMQLSHRMGKLPLTIAAPPPENQSDSGGRGTDDVDHRASGQHTSTSPPPDQQTQTETEGVDTDTNDNPGTTQDQSQTRQTDTSQNSQSGENQNSDVPDLDCRASGQQNSNSSSPPPDQDCRASAQQNSNSPLPPPPDQQTRTETERIDTELNDNPGTTGDQSHTRQTASSPNSQSGGNQAVETQKSVGGETADLDRRTSGQHTSSTPPDQTEREGDDEEMNDGERATENGSQAQRSPDCRASGQRTSSTPPDQTEQEGDDEMNDEEQPTGNGSRAQQSTQSQKTSQAAENPNSVAGETANPDRRASGQRTLSTPPDQTEQEGDDEEMNDEERATENGSRDQQSTQSQKTDQAAADLRTSSQRTSSTPPDQTEREGDDEEMNDGERATENGSQAQQSTQSQKTGQAAENPNSVAGETADPDRRASGQRTSSTPPDQTEREGDDEEMNDEERATENGSRDQQSTQFQKTAGATGVNSGSQEITQSENRGGDREGNSEGLNLADTTDRQQEETANRNGNTGGASQRPKRNTSKSNPHVQSQSSSSKKRKSHVKAPKPRSKRQKGGEPPDASDGQRSESGEGEITYEKDFGMLKKPIDMTFLPNRGSRNQQMYYDMYKGLTCARPEPGQFIKPLLSNIIGCILHNQHLAPEEPVFLGNNCDTWKDDLSAFFDDGLPQIVNCCPRLFQLPSPHPFLNKKNVRLEVLTHGMYEMLPDRRGGGWAALHQMMCRNTSRVPHNSGDFQGTVKAGVKRLQQALRDCVTHIKPNDGQCPLPSINDTQEEQERRGLGAATVWLYDQVTTVGVPVDLSACPRRSSEGLNFIYKRAWEMLLAVALIYYGADTAERQKDGQKGRPGEDGRIQGPPELRRAIINGKGTPKAKADAWHEARLKSYSSLALFLTFGVAGWFHCHTDRRKFNIRDVFSLYTLANEMAHAKVSINSILYHGFSTNSAPAPIPSPWQLLNNHLIRLLTDANVGQPQLDWYDAVIIWEEGLTHDRLAPLMMKDFLSEVLVGGPSLSTTATDAPDVEGYRGLEDEWGLRAKRMLLGAEDHQLMLLQRLEANGVITTESGEEEAPDGEEEAPDGEGDIS
ncbi:Golgi to ER traffic- protein [Puccinia graminis f. sp. tritici]|uniref:Golgi to ER traffic-protein n=1 Tax=Puccinia graminis f. sp. tritici TaxID=56615 RepID=A0A5B0MJ87_PUCGR|nr:Golgi to ER traffic- protein [Puccinia graminis f. sp. tritici]